MKHIKSYKLFEEINFNFDEEELKDIENEKIKEKDKKGIFLDYEKEYLEGLGLTQDNRFIDTNVRKSFIETNEYYKIMICKVEVDRSYTHYECVINIPANNLNCSSFKVPITSQNKEERLKILRSLIKKLYIYLWNKDLDPDSIKDKLEKREKMKDIDPYNEENWEEDKSEDSDVGFDDLDLSELFNDL